MTNLSSLTAYVSIPENSAATPGLWDSRFQTVQQNLGQLNADAGSFATINTTVSDLSSFAHGLVFNTSGLSGVVNVGLAPYLATGLGVLSEHTRFAGGSASVATQGVLLVPPGTYKFTSASTISGVFWPLNGAKLQPTSGVTVTLTGSVLAGPYLWADTSQGGNFAFSNLHSIQGEWFIAGDNITDDQPAWTKMVASLPTHSELEFSTPLRVLLKNELVLTGLHGIKMRSRAPALPSGDGVALYWAGPGHTVVGSDASVTSGSSVVDVTTPAFSSDLSGLRFLVDFAASDGGGMFGTVTSVRSVTQLTLDSIASVTLSATSWRCGTAMIYFQSCDHCHFEDFGVNPGRGASAVEAIKGYGGYISANSNVLREKGYAQFQSSHSGMKIVVDGCGPYGAPLATTIQSFTSATEVVLASSASSSIDSVTLTTYIIGTTPTSHPPAYAILSDGNTPNATGTECHFERNVITTPFDCDIMAIAISPAAQVNQEYHVIKDNHVNLNNTLEQRVSVISMTAGSKIVTASDSIFEATRTGQRYRIPNMGSGGSYLDTKIVTVLSGTMAIMKDAASSTTTVGRIIRGEGHGYGAVIGNSPNAKRIIVYNNTFAHMKWGIWQRGGSCAPQNTSYTANEADVRRDGSTEASVHIMDNTEGSLRFIDMQGGRETTTLKSCRLGNANNMPGGGYMRMGVHASTLVLEGCGIDNATMEPNSTIFEFSSSGNLLDLRDNTYNSVSPTIQQLGFNQAVTVGALVSTHLDAYIADSPGRAFSLTVGSAGSKITASRTLPPYGEVVFLVDASASTITLSLPVANTGYLYPRYAITKIDASAFPVMIAPTGGELINGGSSSSVTLRYTGKNITTDGVNWYAF